MFTCLRNMYHNISQLYFKQHLPIFAINLVLLIVYVIVVLSPRYIPSRNTCTSILIITVALQCNYICLKGNLLLLSDLVLLVFEEFPVSLQHHTKKSKAMYAVINIYLFQFWGCTLLKRVRKFCRLMASFLFSNIFMFS